MNKKTGIRIATMNARSFLGGSKPNKNQLKKYSTSADQSIDILCLQDISAAHTSTTLTVKEVNTMKLHFKDCPSIHTKYAAVIILNPAYSSVNESIHLQDRCITATIVETKTSVILFHLINIYAPPQDSLRHIFLQDLSAFIQSRYSPDDRTIILGDFNLNMHKRLNPKYDGWCQMIHSNYTNSALYSRMERAPTFTRGDARTTIDYIYVSNNLQQYITGFETCYLPSTWTDHNLMYIDLASQEDQQMGQGTWRMNPQLIENKSFQLLLSETLTQLGAHFQYLSPSTDKQTQWETVKTTLKNLS